MKKDKYSYSELKDYIIKGKDLYQAYKKPSYRKKKIWEYYKKHFVKCAIWSFNCFFISVIGILDNGDIQIEYPTRTITIKKR